VPIPIGYHESGKYFLYNHLHFDLLVVPSLNDTERFNVVSFSVRPLSIDHEEMDKQDSLLSAKAKAGSPEDIAVYLRH
jgi:hypothetical protein